MSKRFTIVNAIAYVNSIPHIGHALELVQSDTLARYHRLQGEEVIYTTGTDENALKNVQASEKSGKQIKEFVDEHAGVFLELNKSLNISADEFIRTTEERHAIGVRKLWEACEKTGDIYKKKYSGLYCVGCEVFYLEKDLVDGLCPEHKTKPEFIEEENYFFRLSKYQDWLLEILEEDVLKITPPSRKSELTEFIKSGLEDFSISRSNNRAKNWGISVPGDDTQKIYVWFDALTNYINALGYGIDEKKFEKWWSDSYKAHMIGKGIGRFHAVYWPAMLKSAGIVIPNEIFIHGYITVEGQKMSKSIGNVVDPFEVVNKYGVDVVRYYLLREIPSTGDGDFSVDKLEERYSADLANNLGNLVSRVAKLIETKMEKELDYKDKFMSKRVMDEIELVKKVYHEKISQFKLNEALSDIWALLSFANAYIDEKKPWATVETDPEEFIRNMTSLLRLIIEATYLLEPFMPDTSISIRNTFGVKNKIESYTDQKFIIGDIKPLFPRLS